MVETECIEFVSRSNNGFVAGPNARYPETRVDGVRMEAHRAAWVRANGPIPDGLVVRHLCHNKRCVSIDHLAIGTQADNIADSVADGRMNRPFGHDRTVGARHGMAKLDDDTVRDIVRRLADGESQRLIARDVGVSQATISMIATGKRWTHVTLGEKWSHVNTY